MKQEFGDLISAFDAFISKSETIDQWRNIRFIYDFYKDQFIANLAKNRAKVRKQQPADQEMVEEEPMPAYAK